MILLYIYPSPPTCPKFLAVLLLYYILGHTLNHAFFSTEFCLSPECPLGDATLLVQSGWVHLPNNWCPSLPFPSSPTLSLFFLESHILCFLGGHSCFVNAQSKVISFEGLIRKSVFSVLLLLKCLFLFSHWMLHKVSRVHTLSTKVLGDDLNTVFSSGPVLKFI